MKQHPRWVWLMAVVLGWLLDFLFWKQSPGLNFALYVALCLVGGLFILRLDQRRMATRSAWLLPLILFFAVSTFIRSEPLTLFLGVVLTFLLMAVLAATFLSGRWLEYSLTDHALALLRLGWSAITRPIAFRSELRKARPANQRTGTGLWPVLRGILLALPILVLFGALLASADLVVGRDFDDLIRLLRLERLPEYVFRLVYICLAAYALLGVFLCAANSSQDEHLVGRCHPPSLRFLGFIESSIVLGSVTLLFGAFVVVQFQYFFGGQVNIGVDGFTYSEYARRGYGELMAVAVFSLLMILGLGAITRRESAAQQRLFSTLSVLIVAMVGVMLVSAYMRLALYEAAYGFSRLRTYVHVSLVWLGVLLAVVVVLEMMHRERQVAAAVLLASIGFTLTLNVVNVDAFIVRQNVDRALRGAELDVPYLASLSDDSVPALAALFRSSSSPVQTREAVGVALACRLQEPGRTALADWRSFTVSRWRAQRLLEGLRNELAEYQLVKGESSAEIITPRGATQNCYGYYAIDD
jgi:hypothetical protein